MKPADMGLRIIDYDSSQKLETSYICSPFTWSSLSAR